MTAKRQFGVNNCKLPFRGKKVSSSLLGHQLPEVLQLGNIMVPENQTHTYNMLIINKSKM